MKCFNHLLLGALLFCSNGSPLYGLEKLPNNFNIASWWNVQKSVRYPLVDEQRRVTFKIHAPSASHVNLLLGEWNVIPQTMGRAEDGYWILTTGPLVPGVYCYLFDVDGQRLLDLGNPNVKVGTEVYGSTIEVRGDTPRYDEVRSNPHGTIETIVYNSQLLGAVRRMAVYLPPSYSEKSSSTFPVLYLRHGGGDNASSWINDGRAGTILDNLLEQEGCVPMIVVMPDCLVDGTWAGGSTPEGMNLLERELVEVLIPEVERRFRAQPDRDGRAIAGLSMGGGQAFVMGLRNLEKFSWVGEFSAGLLSASDFELNAVLPGVRFDSELNQRLHCLWMGCGDLDPRFNGHVNLVNQLKTQGVRVARSDSHGGHEWQVWREQLREFCKVLFRIRSDSR